MTQDVATSTVLYCTAHCTVLYCTLYSTVLYSAVHYNVECSSCEWIVFEPHNTGADSWHRTAWSTNERTVWCHVTNNFMKTTSPLTFRTELLGRSSSFFQVTWLHTVLLLVLEVTFWPITCFIVGNQKDRHRNTQTDTSYWRATVPEERVAGKMT